MTASNDAGALEALLDDGWQYHDTQSERLARELETAAAQRIDTALLAPFLHLATHTLGEHLDDWPRALRLARRALDGQTPAAESAKAWARAHVAALLAGDADAAQRWQQDYLEAAGSDAAAARLELRFLEVGAQVGSKRLAEAVTSYGAALTLIEHVPVDAALARTIAAVSNNFGWELYELPTRSAELDALLRRCADTALAYWRRGGNWIHEERALYFRALVSNALRDPDAALADADAALAVIAANAPRPLDAALLHLARAAALAARGDGVGHAQAIADADDAGAKLTAPELTAQFVAARARTLGGT